MQDLKKGSFKKQNFDAFFFIEQPLSFNNFFYFHDYGFWKEFSKII